MNRNYKKTDLKLLWGRSGGFCAHPNCYAELTDYNSDAILGNICHIRGLKRGSPRHDSNYPTEKINLYENLILLCRNHHIIVDTDSYSVKKLLELKSNHERDLRVKQMVGNPLQLGVSTIFYLNIPRLSILAAQLGYDIDSNFLKGVGSLIETGFEIGKILQKFKTLLHSIHPNTTKLDLIQSLDKSLIGLTVLFNREFEGKNIPDVDQVEHGYYKMSSKIELTPQIFSQFENFKLILTIDPKWITTSTGFVGLDEPGVYGELTGIAIIKSVDEENQIILASPLVIGIPISVMDQLFS